MTGPSSAEVLGDWNNVKGIHYHFVYAIWLLMRGDVTELAFYRGNDLWARPAPPPQARAGADVISAALRATRTDSDLWVQLKSTSDAWTLTELLSENLLANYLSNALQSRREGREWQIQLVTQGPVRRTAIRQFTDKLDNPTHLKKLRTIVQRVKKQWSDAGMAHGLGNDDNLLALGVEILRKLSDTEPKNLLVLVREVELSLWKAFPNAARVSQIANTLLGALLSSTQTGPEQEPTYNADWLDQVAGVAISPRSSPVDDCSALAELASRKALPLNWGGQSGHLVRREPLETALYQFLAGPETVFVLTGASGVGKSWALSHWAMHQLNGRVRLLVTGADLLHLGRLEPLIGSTLRSVMVRDWSDEMLFHHLLTAAAINPDHSLVLIVDDLAPGTDQPGALATNIQRLVTDCHHHRIKLVLICQEQSWQLLHLHRSVPVDLLFASDPTLKRSVAPYSYRLNNYEDGEFTAAVQALWGVDAALQLSAPGYEALRNPYLLSLYARQLGAEARPIHRPLAAVDDILDSRLQDLLSAAAAELRCSLQEAEQAFQTLTIKLWEKRPSGLSAPDAGKVLANEIGTPPANALLAFRRTGLLTHDVPIRIAEPLLGDRVLARQITATGRSPQEIASELKSKDDSGVLAALLRGSLRDPILITECLLAQSDEWLIPVCDGLAQCSPDDYRVLALLTTLVHSRHGDRFYPPAAHALGRLSARGWRGRKWLVGTYLSERSLERFWAEHALAGAMPLIPRHVAAAVRLRLSRAARIADFFASEWEARKDYLAGALVPFHMLGSRAAAEAATGVTNRNQHLIGAREDRFNYRFMRELDEVRGNAALLGVGVSLQHVLSDLDSSEVLTRYRSASALRPITFARPDLVCEGLCMAIQCEDHNWVLKNLLFASYRLAETEPVRLLSALIASQSAARFDQSNRSSGLSLPLLARIATALPAAVTECLPSRLDTERPYARALLSSVHAFAWWVCADASPDARTQLAALTEPDVENLDAVYHVFALHGAAVAQLGVMCLSIIPAAELHGFQMFYSGSDLDFSYLDTDAFARRHGAALLTHEACPELMRLLLAAVRADDYFSVHPVDNWNLRDWEFRCSQLCMELIVQIIRHDPDVLPVLRELPRDWQALRASWQLLEAGRCDPALMEFARVACDEHAAGGSAQAFAERVQCLAQLARLNGDQPRALESFRTQVAQFSPFANAAAGLTQLVDAVPSNLLHLLGQFIQSADDLPALCDWSLAVRSWQGLLIARVYGRMFDERFISPREADELCTQLLTAVDSLPPSIEKGHYQGTYLAVRDRLRGHQCILPTVDSPADVISSSHFQALRILQQAGASTAEEADTAWLQAMVLDRRGWWSSPYHGYVSGRIISC